MNFRSLTAAEEEIARKIVHCAYLVHKTLGPGLLENIYERCFCYELRAHGLKCERQIETCLKYGDMEFDN